MSVMSEHPPNNVREWRTLPEWAYPALCVAVLSLLTMLPAKGGPLFPKQIDIDSSVYRYVGKVILSGGAPYRDTFDHKGPFLYFIQVAGLVLGYYGVWLMGILNCLFTFAFFYKIARLCGCSLRLSCTALIFVALLFPYYQVHINAAESYSLPFLSASLYCFLRYFMERNVTKPQIALCGFSCAALFLLKPNFVGLFLVTLPGIIADRIRKKQFQAIFHDAFYFSLGFLALALPTSLWLSFNRAFTDFIRTVLLFKRTYSQRGRQAL